ncbi:hypothetical protein B0H16DRAFT_388738 [Mycena metata]|uniref:Uncharacterized protein n=1 Tax=Mycena metata TaxID=1033252 RepID=A0AAD7NL15_9AGAR|nr:hypothetical protein B0H16DRAFT_388738 [Mycena metata]
MVPSHPSTGKTIVNDASQLLSPAISILDNTLHIRHNKPLFGQLARDAGALAYAAGQPDASPSLVDERLGSSIRLLITIDRFIVHHLGQNRLSRALDFDLNKKIQGFRAQIKELLDVLNPDILFHLSKTTEEVRAKLHELKDQLDRPRSSPAVSALDVETHPDYNQSPSSPDTKSIDDSGSTASSVTDVASSTELPSKQKFYNSPDARLDTKLDPVSTTGIPPLQLVPPAIPLSTSPSGALSVNYVDQARGNFFLGEAHGTINIHTNYIDSAAPPSQRPENVALVAELRKLMLAHRHLIPILGVAIAFREAPSALQISRVLKLASWTHVADALQLVSPYLDRLDSPIWKGSDVRVPNLIREALLQRTAMPWIDPRVYHARIAEWCLVGKREMDARDIVYRAEFWAVHICESVPSTPLFDALRKSTLPSKPESRAKLQGVIYWLKPDGVTQAPDLVTQASDLVDIYRRRLDGPLREEVEIMGGEMKMPV